MIKVKARGEEALDHLLRRFKKLCEKEGLTKDVKRAAHYEKPSEERRRRIRQVRKRELKRIQLQEKYDLEVKKRKRRLLKS
ncbi:MAG: 30S ribosomal protein S21 [Planctomycetota bacterium]|nr:30S ribosomal protein S21 [Planctomycetota bacterium]